MRGRILAGVILVLGALAPVPPSAVACSGEECGVPECWSPPQRVRPAMPRALYINCSRAIGVKVVSGPAHGTVSEVSQEWGTIRFTVRADEDAPRHDEIVLSIEGEWKTIEQRLPIEVKPLSENAPPECYGAQASKRSSGSEPVELYLSPWCYDPDGDEFTTVGGGPGTHLDAPAQTASNNTLSSWRYRTATHSGSETAQLWATDILGARSADATLEVTVGPDIDRLAACGTNSASMYDYMENLYEIRARPGVPRRFGIYCGDPDGDPFVMAPSALPSHGVFAPVLATSYADSAYTYQQYDSTYVPASDTMEPDEFAVTATGTRGSQQLRLRIAPRALPDNGGGWCGWGGAWTTENVPGTFTVECTDDEGDPMSVEILEAPRHGTTGPPVTAPGLFGTNQITIPYVPAPGFVGYDCIKVKVTDGHGFEQTILLEAQVQKLLEQPVAVPDLPPLPPLPAPLPPTLPRPGGPVSPRAVDAIVKPYVEQALGTASVRRLPSTGPAHVWAPVTLSKRGLLSDGVEPAMIVICPHGCRLRSQTELFSGSPVRARASRRKSAHVLAPGTAHLLWMAVGQDQRPALRRAKSARAAYRLGLRQSGIKPRALKGAIPVKR